jgi:hypothetical protein
MKAGWLVATTLLAVTTAAHSQPTPKPFGWVTTTDAAVVGAPNTSFRLVNSRAELAGTATVTAKAGHNAEVALARGGSVLVCQSTALHLTASTTAANQDSLLLALDRGAMEIRMKGSASDVVMTPDLRFTLAAPGPLDLQMRVTFNGDTCVENRGSNAPPLNIADSFGEASYLLKPGQHVMFEHGSLKAVMDRETTPCGCPPLDEQKPMSLADALLRGGQNTPVTPQQAAALHPFPTAQSDGLAAPPPAVPETPGERHVQVATTLVYNPDPTASSKAEPPVVAAVAPPAPPAPPKRRGGPFAAIGRFFKRLFVR